MTKTNGLDVNAQQLSSMADEALKMGDKSRCIEIIDMLYNVYSRFSFEKEDGSDKRWNMAVTRFTIIPLPRLASMSYCSRMSLDAVL